MLLLLLLLLFLLLLLLLLSLTGSDRPGSVAQGRVGGLDRGARPVEGEQEILWVVRWGWGGGAVPEVR